MYGQRSESLGGALTETDVAKAGLRGGGEDVSDAIRDVVEGELIHAEVPEGSVGRGVV